MAHIIDTPNNVVGHFDRLKAAGIDTVIRYLAPSANSWKVVGTGEAKAIAAAGLRLGLVFEGDGHPNGSVQGFTHGHAALAQAQAVGAPDGAVIWGTVDYDPSHAAIPGIISWYRAFKASISGKYRIGSYCSGYCAQALIDAGGIIDTTKDLTTNTTLPLIWITQSLGFAGSRDYLNSGKPFVYFQLLPHQTAGLDADPDITWHNYLNEKIDDGSFVPFAPVAVA